MNETENKSTFCSQFFIWAAVICLCTFVAVLIIPNFIKARATSADGACINNLRRFQEAKDQWALEHNAKTNDVVTGADIKPYIKLAADGHFPKCPQGGFYTIGKVGENVTCSLGTNIYPAHILPQ
jgi:hypothetical protein